ncbi:MAG: hypothetical protein ACOVNU_00955 [Candidatus Kapaibacteriota bacterium]|jgi:hypothetical protein
MVAITKEKVQQVQYYELLFQMHILKSKLELFTNKYKSNLEEFESQIKSSDTENFELWDDMMEWKAYQKSYEEIKEIINSQNATL